MRKLTPKRQKEVNDLVDWCEFVCNTTYDLYDETRSNKSLRQFQDMQLDVLRKARERGDLRGLRMVHRDYVEEISGLAPQHLARMDRLLREKFGRGLDAAKGKIEKKVHSILKRGNIKKADEYRILEAWIGMILDDPAKASDIERINALLATVTQPLPE
ncbi:hypothetical protein [Taklimakanibacter lacteus]|uniref:hypothetical protein n=1 Tax=Taklimakanibacter lacteus TaxID=2268456 RepID=UPI0013C5015B